MVPTTPRRAPATSAAAWPGAAARPPTLTEDLVIFTDNLDPINLFALSSDTGEILAQIPILDQLGEDVPVAVENSILVYDGGAGTVSVIVANWFGAGNAGLADPNANSAIQSYDNIYDANWMAQGNAYIAPGVEQADFVAADGSDLDCAEQEYQGTFRVVLAQKQA